MQECLAMKYLRRLAIRGGASVCLLFGALGHGTLAHTSSKVLAENQKNTTNPVSAKWIEDKVAVRVDSPSLTDSGDIVLAYTLTNKTGRDITLDFAENPASDSNHIEAKRIFLKLKDPDSFSQVSPRDHFLYFVDTLLVPDIPISFRVVVRVSADERPSWFSSDSDEDRLRKLLGKKLGNVDSIAIFIPDRRLKITLRIPSGARK